MEKDCFRELSHAIETIPTHFDHVLNDLNAIINTKIQQAQTGAEFEKIEKEMHAAFVAAERRVLSEILAQYDLDVPFVMLDERGIEKIIQHLSYQLKKHPKKDSLKT